MKSGGRITKDEWKTVTLGGIFDIARGGSPRPIDYFYHLLGSDVLYAEFERRAAGATVKNLNIDFVKSIEVLLPPLREQRRIAAVLDQAEALRAKRRAALAELDILTQSLFVDLFGDPTTNPKNWPSRTLGELIIDGPQTDYTNHRLITAAELRCISISVTGEGVPRVVSTAHDEVVRGSMGLNPGCTRAFYGQFSS